MAASDQNYRTQHTLDIVFAVTSTLMLASIVLMFWQDYFREYKTEQRSFRDVEAGVAQRMALLQLPSKAEFDQLEAKVTAARKNQKNDEIDSIKRQMADNQKPKERWDATFQDKKATIDSRMSFYNAYVDKHGKKEGDEKFGAELANLTRELDEAKAKRDEYDENLKKLQREMSELTTPLTEAESEWKKLNDRFETQAKLAINKQWRFTDTIRDFPVLDGFAPAIKIHQFTISDVPIDFNFKYVKRFDRCMTCHQGIDRPTYTKDMLESLKNPLPASLRPQVDDFWNAVAAVTPKEKPEETTRLGKAGWSKEILSVFLAADYKKVPVDKLAKYDSGAISDLKSRWESIGTAAGEARIAKDTIANYLMQKRNLLEAQGLLEARIKTLGSAEASKQKFPSPDQLTINFLPDAELTPARIKEFCGHPRQELFVGANSKHPAEKFGCTSCHQGQGAATTFTGSFHSPNNSETKKAWEKEHDFGKDTHTFLWDFPMLPSRFIESSCLKCHHQVTDLFGVANRNEAPKLLRGAHLIHEAGCYGCHEIQGRKGGRSVGPDIRLEPNPPLEELSEPERKAIESDADNRPGDQRKVGPSLYRLSEKTNKEWAVRWLKAPREFRPDTMMPHFYGLSNNTKDALPELEKDLPDTEMQAIAHYLFGASDSYLKELATLHKDGKAASDQQRLSEILAQPRLSAADKKELADNETTGEPGLRRRVRMRQAPLLEDKTPMVVNKDGKSERYQGNVPAGRQLFSEKGCLACHSHKGTEAEPLVASSDPSFAPKVASAAQFGPNLGQIADKLGKAGDKDAARKWLVQWILDPHLHSPRSRMPVTHLTPAQATDLAAWLLSQPALDLGDGWDKVQVAEPKPQALKKLAEVYFVRLLPAALMEKLLKGEKIDDAAFAALPLDEQKLSKRLQASKNPEETPDILKFYLGKKAVGRMGCFGCHDVPGFDTAKPIGVGLMDWGKKDPERLAFEDIAAYVKDSYHVVPNLKDKDGKPIGYEVKDGKRKAPYEAFFAESLSHHQREGFLNQKLLEPRSYDYNRRLAWDDRSRMPQFKFARSRMKEGETKEQFEARQLLEEAEAREAVMTFILGLVAEPVPLKSINEPSGDRLAEVKGRQVLSKFNCAGCHLIQPGVFDFKVSKAGNILLDKSFDLVAATKTHVFPNHYNWAGKNPETPDRLMAQGVAPKLGTFLKSKLLAEGETDPVDMTDPESVARAKGDMLSVISLRLGHALRYQTAHTSRQFLTEARTRELAKTGDDRDEDVIKKLDKLLEQDSAYGDLRDIRASNFIRVPVADMIYPPPSVFATEENLGRRLAEIGPYGGTFSDLLMGYLVAKDKDKSTVFYKFDGDGDSNYARAAGPPSLIDQGARTQTAWLHNFLLDPQPVRRMTVLRMPKFNMSEDDAKTLVAYFAAVSRLQNTGTRLDFPNQVIPQQHGFDSDFWQDKTRAYVARLQKAKTAKGTSAYEDRLEFLEPWLDGKLEVAVKASSKRVAVAQKEMDEAKKAVEEAKAGKKNVDLKEREAAAKEQALADAKENEAAWIVWEDEERKQTKTLSREAKIKAWEENDAYLADAYKMVTQICVECHQVGKLGTAQIIPGKAQGPPLQEVFKRIRPGWGKYWIAHPQYMLPYSAVMPVNFEAGKKNWQDRMIGTSLEQVVAARDVIMVLPRIEALPVNRFWRLSLPGVTTEKPAEKK